MKPVTTIWHLLVALLLMQPLALKAQHYVSLGGEVDSLLVLPKLGADSAYLVNESLAVVAGGDLRVEAGAKVYFGQSAYLRVDGGRLSLDGHRNDSVYLLCYEFSHDWVGVQLKNVGEADSLRLSYVTVIGALTALNASESSHVTVRHCTFNNFYAGKGIEMIDCSNFLIDSCFFNQCVSGVELKSRSADSEDNYITHNIFDQGQINIELSNTGYGFKCNRNHIEGNCFQGAATAINFETLGGISDKDATNYIEGNLISSDLPGGGGSGYSSYGIKAAMDTLVIRNNVFWNNDEAVRMMRVCHLLLEHNTFFENELTLTNLLASGSAVFVGNTISEAKKRIVSYPSGKSRMNGNNFLHFQKNTTLFANVSTDVIDMQGNHWGDATEAEIASVVLDAHDTPTLGEILIDGYLPECDTTVPISPPFRVKKQYVNNQWRISWEANPEADVDHYVLFYGDFNYYKFAHAIDGITSTSYDLTPQQADNVAVMACDREYNPDVYASLGQSAYAFAEYYPYAGEDATMCAPQNGYSITSAIIPYTYSGFVWRSSGSGSFSDSLALRTVYYPSEADYDTGTVTLTLRVLSNGVAKTDAFQLQLYKALAVFAGDDNFSGMNHPLTLDQAEASNYDSLRWRSLGDGRFGDSLSLHTVYYPGPLDKEQGYVELMLEVWSFCGYASDVVRFDLLKDFAMEGKTWMDGVPRPNTQVIAASISDDNPYVSGFYRTISDDEGTFQFDALLPDTYILYAFPDTLEVEAGGSYYLGDLQWNESNMIVVDGNVYDVDITLPAVVEGFNMGQGSIGGMFDYPEMPFRGHDFYCQPWLREGSEVEYCSGDGLSNVGVLLLNATKQKILGFALTDHSGRFCFRHLPFGTYHVMADLPRYGRGTCEEISISPSQPSVDGLHLFVSQQGKVCMRKEDNGLENSHLYVYPNPVIEELSMGGLECNTDYVVTVVNSLGIRMISEYAVRTDLLGEFSIHMGALPAGMYFIRVSNPSTCAMAKIVKQ